MDPAVDVLTIHPAAWTALFQGLAEGIALGLAGVASVLLAVVALVGCLGRGAVDVATPGDRAACAGRAAAGSAPPGSSGRAAVRSCDRRPAVAPAATTALAGFVPLVWGARPLLPARRRPRQVCRRHG